MQWRAATRTIFCASSAWPSMGLQSEPVDSELNRETGTAARRLLAPPAGPIDGARAIYWNERELRAGWRLLLYLVLFVAIGGAESFAAFRLHLPAVSYTNITATGLLVQEVILVCAAFAARSEEH